MGNTVTVRIEEGAIILKHSGDVEYDIELSRCNSHGLIMAWVHQLSQKNWMTTEAVADFIEMACAESKISMPWELGI